MSTAPIRQVRQTPPGRQHGLGLIGLILIGGLLVVAAMVALKVVPTALEFTSIQRATQAARDQPSPQAVRTAFDRRASMDDITSIAGKDLEIRPAQGGTFHVAFAYEKRIPLFGPASLLIEYRGDTGAGR